jgi:hypothetical protein
MHLLKPDERKIIKAKECSQRDINRKAVFTPPAFHPKALRFIICIWQVFWLVSCLLPSHPACGGTVAAV